MSAAFKVGGWKRQAASSKDVPFRGVKARIAEATSTLLDLRHWCSPVEDQGRLGSCVGNAVVSGLELLNIKAGRPHVDLSRLFVYYNARRFHGAADKDEGTYIRLAMNTLEALGTCRESDWPYLTSDVFKRPRWTCYREAYGHKIGRYELISGTGSVRNDAIVDALSGGYPVVFGMDVDTGFQATGADGVVRFGGPGLGGHAQLIVGADLTKRLFIVRNSWGRTWGHDGYCYVPFGSLDDQNANDLWVAYEASKF